jgi:TolB protein
MDREGNNVERVSFGYPCAVSPAWSPDGQFLSYAVKKAGIYTLILHDMDKKTDNEMSSALGWSEEPSWAPDSMHIVFTRREGDKPSLWVLDVFTEEARPLCPGSSSPDFRASWSH